MAVAGDTGGMWPEARSMLWGLDQGVVVANMELNAYANIAAVILDLNVCSPSQVVRKRSHA